MPTTEKPTSHSQTLSRGLRALELLAEAPEAMSIAELATGLGVHRSIAYRILRTLEDHALVMRDDTGRVQGAPGLAALARGVQRDLQSAALPELGALANELGMTSFLAVWDHHDCTTLLTVEPRGAQGMVVQRPGSRHPIERGAPGIAIQSAFSPAEWAEEAPGEPYGDVAMLAREAGYASSRDQVIKGVTSIAAPLRVPGHLPAALAVVFTTASTDIDADELGARLIRAAESVRRALGG